MGKDRYERQAEQIIYSMMGSPVSPVIACFTNAWMVERDMKEFYKRQVDQSRPNDRQQYQSKPWLRPHQFKM